MKKGNIYLWTGNGWGKTTSAIGVAIRAIGHGYKVIMIQFMKGRITGEVRAASRIKGFSVKQFGRKGWVNLRKPSGQDKKLAQDALEYAKEVIKKKPFLLILDEINIAVKFRLLKEKDVVEFLDKVPKKVHVYLTGRYATKGLIRKADYVNYVDMRKGPKRLIGEKGIDF